MDEIWFWQRIVSPHMAGLALALARRGCNVTYVAEQAQTADRAKLGWQMPDMQGVRLCFASDSVAINVLVQDASVRSVHICQGIRGNGTVSTAQRALTRRGLRQWMVMETVDDAGVVGMVKRWAYARQFRGKGRSLEGVLATGHNNMDWIIERGMSANRVYPFTYFLPDVRLPEPGRQRRPGPFRILFVGQFIPRKRLDLLVHTLRALMDHEFQLLVVGAGPQEVPLRRLSESALPDRVCWLGRRAQAEVPQIMAQADCLVLPSRHDGWGAVISEALMAGTPVICSDACGAAGVVQVSGVGGVFPRNSGDELRANLQRVIESGPLNTEGRIRLASWASALGAEAGSRYLLNILDCAASGGSRPMPPWHTGGHLCA